jgi:DNA-directed RNA polymerase specialized sigma24 family protein
VEQRDDAKPIDGRPAGWAGALVALVQRYQQPLGAYVFHLVGDLDLALAVTGETFLRWHAAAASSSAAEDDLRLALYRMATSLALSRGREADATGLALRRVGYTEATGLKPGRTGNADTDGLELGRIWDMEAAGRIPRQAPRGEAAAVDLTFAVERGLAEVALQHLALGERAVLLLCDLEQFPIDDVAVVLGVSGHTVRRRLAQARGRFRQAYVEACGARD